MRDPRLDLALSLAAEGGRRAVASLGHVSSAWKRPGERVTSVDTEIQSRMLREIQTWFPGDGVVAEEAGGRLGVDREFVWALDVDERATLWDIAAGGTILLEAGGSLSALDGAPLFPVDLARVLDAPMPFVAGNGGAHGEAVAALAREPAFDVLRSPRRLGLEPDRRAQ